MKPLWRGIGEGSALAPRLRVSGVLGAVAVRLLTRVLL
jgi:hypothetical protein